ncbi:MAG: DNA helicase UvrD [Candidatus Firestonebacteria bacterium]|nr:DNA helicase UvrD [Candidatus Firestonebacteria bacterium]
MKPFIADFHIHSHFSIATSKECMLEYYYKWAELKGVNVVGTGDFTHPGWLAEMEKKLIPKEEGLFDLKPELIEKTNTDVPLSLREDVRFILSSEISCIYKKNGRVRKIHSLILVSNFNAVKKINSVLEKIGNIHSDGRPILGLDAKNLLEIVLESDPDSFYIPAHIWTPHFSLFGAGSGFDTIEECFEDLTPHIFALETGLSSDPAMNFRLTALDKFSLVSNSDAHSPRNLAREANIFECEKNFVSIKEAIKTKNKFNGTIEFFPEEGKYHYDGHRLCKVNLAPWETISNQGLCPVCGKKVTIGVMHRVELLATRKKGENGESVRPFESLIPLAEILAELEKSGRNTKKVQNIYFKLLSTIGNELYILREAPLSDIEKAGFSKLAFGIKRMREGKVIVVAGYDGEYGKIKVFYESSDELSQGIQLKLL